MSNATGRAAGAPILALLAGLVVALLAQPGAAHEVRATVADLALRGDTVTLTLDLNVEAFVAGVDLDGLDDINAVPQSERYDALRALPPEALAERFAPVAERMAGRIALLRDDGTPLALGFVGVDIAPVGDVETLRDARAAFAAPVVAPLSGLRVAWPEGYGALILRQVGVAEGFTGFLDGGGASDRIDMSVAAQPAARTLRDALAEGFARVLPGGPVQVLFVLAVVVLSMQPALLWPQLAAVAAGVAAGLALAFAGPGGTLLPAGALGPLTAVTVTLVALDNLRAATRAPWRLPGLAAFGALHGLALAGAGAGGLVPGGVVAAALGAGGGIALALLTVVALAYLVFGAWTGAAPWYRRRVAVPASLALAVAGGALALLSLPG
jgi:hypothetical protein